MTPRARRARLALAPLWLAWLVAAPALADFREAYRKGTEALDAKKWSEAVRWLEEAIAERPEENVGMFRRYLPHYYLGVAYLELDDCGKALAAWAESERQGAINGLQEYGDMLHGREVCRGRQKDQQLRRALEQLDDQIGQASEGRDRVQALRRRPELETAPAAAAQELAERQQQADRRLDEARRVMRTGRRHEDLGDIGQAQNWAVEARQAYAGIEADLRQRLELLRGRLDAGRQALQDRLGEALDLLAAIRRLRPLPAGLAASAAAVEGRLEAVRGAEPTTPPAELAALEQALAEAVARLRAAAQPPPRLLRRAAEEFVAGAYPAVLEVLAEFGFNDPRAAAHAYLLRAASHWALAQAAGEAGDELRAAAREDALSCMASDDSVAPVESVFSPRFVAFFEALRPTAPGGSS